MNILSLAKNKAAQASAGVFAFGVSGLASANVDTTTIIAGLDAAEASAHTVAGAVVAIVAGLVVVGVIIGIVRKV